MLDLSSFKKQNYTPYETPLERAKKLELFLGNQSPTIYIKRDDMLGLTGGGNKTRKLEFLMADAIDRKANAIITCGAIQSNHCRLTLAAAIRENCECHLILEERIPNTFDQDASGNNFLFQLLGATSITIASKEDNIEKKMKNIANELTKKGKKPYIIPGGGSNEIGALGYVNCFHEIDNQINNLNIKPSRIICTSGSSGTHAGLVSGINVTNSSIECIGISVMRSKIEQTELVKSLASKTNRLLQSQTTIKEKDVIIYDNYIGNGYSLPTPEMIEAVTILAQTEGILLDPVYTGKAFAGMIDLIRKKQIKSNETIIFIHTGGSPALYAYQKDFNKTLNTIYNQS
tara:strand:- start:7989 stop:9023 length:1035 start_codon:yes stop_codon:yes gene_type:complete